MEIKQMNSKKFKFKHSIRAWVSKPTRPNQQLGLSCLSLSSPCLTSMSRKSKTSLLKGRVGVGGGDGASTKFWTSSTSYEGSSNIVEGVANMSTVRTWIGLSFGTLNIHEKKRNMRTCKKLQSKKIEMQTNKLEANIEFTHTTNQNLASPSSRGEEQKWTLVVGQLAGKCAFAQAHAWKGGETLRCRWPTRAPQYGVEWSGKQWHNP